MVDLFLNVSVLLLKIISPLLHAHCLHCNRKLLYFELEFFLRVLKSRQHILAFLLFHEPHARRKALLLYLSRYLDLLLLFLLLVILYTIAVLILSLTIWGSFRSFYVCQLQLEPHLLEQCSALLVSGH